jgi:acyl carrier protein
MSDRDNTFERVKAVIVEEIEARPEEVTSEAYLDGDLAADSLDIVNIMMALEDEFEIDIPDQEAYELRTVQDIVNYIDRVRAFK